MCDYAREVAFAENVLNGPGRAKGEAYSAARTTWTKLYRYTRGSAGNLVACLCVWLWFRFSCRLSC
jgi:hypothetical protein